MADSASSNEQENLPGFTAGGPYLAMAILCEKVLREADGVLSVIRVIDRINVAVSGSGAPTVMPPIPISLTAVVAFKSGFVRGPYTARVQVKGPSQQVLSTVELPMLLEGDDRGANLVMELGFQAEEEGVYWFDVSVDGVLFTKMPLRLVYQRMSLSR